MPSYATDTTVADALKRFGVPTEGIPDATRPTAMIANGTSLTPAIDLAEGRLHRIVMPASWTSAALTFKASPDGVTFYDVYDASGEYTISSSIAGASRSIVIDPTIFYGMRYIQIRSGTTGTPVNQGADRTLTLIIVPKA